MDCLICENYPCTCDDDLWTEYQKSVKYTQRDHIFDHTIYMKKD